MRSLQYSSQPKLGRSWIGFLARLLAIALVGLAVFSGFRIFQGLTRPAASGPQSAEERIIQDAMAAVEQNPKNADARWRLSVALSTVKDYDRAFAEAEQAVRLDSKKAECFYALGLAYRGLGDRGRAIKALRKAVSIPGAFGEVYREMYYDLGQTLSQAGRDKEAVEAYKNALVNGPEATYVVLALADSLRKNGDIPLAKREYLSVLGYDPTNVPAEKALRELKVPQSQIDAAKKSPDLH